MSARALCLIAILSCFALAAAECDPTTECCMPGTAQEGDEYDTYLLNIGNKVPAQLNFVDYCTEEVIFTTYFTVVVDKFSVVYVPCTFTPSKCNLLPTEAQAACEANAKLWNDPNGAFRCNSTGNFFANAMSGRICNRANYNPRTSNNTEWIFRAGVPAPNEEIPATTGSCNCNRTTAMARLNGTENLTIGVPDGFVKEGMATFYTQLVIGGRKTSDPEPGCLCTGPDDTSAACMCMLGTKKVPYVYNYSFVPYFTALVSIKNGGLIYTNTYIKYNFDSNGMGCVGCPPDSCWGVPKVGLEGWTNMGRDLKKQEGKMCAISGSYNTLDPAQPYCQFPTSEKDVTVCSLKVYVAWVGTDGYNQNCQSNNEMFSKFTQMGVSSMAWQFYSGASNLLTDVSSRVSGRRWFPSWFGEDASEATSK